MPSIQALPFHVNVPPGIKINALVTSRQTSREKNENNREKREKTKLILENFDNYYRCFPLQKVP